MKLFRQLLGAEFLTSLVQAQASDPITNPYNASCPVPPNYTISNFNSTSGDNGTIFLQVTYGRGTWTCPNFPTHGDRYDDGTFDVLCDNNGLGRVITDGFSYIWIQEWFWCLNVPQQHDSYNTLSTTANFTGLADILDCTVDYAGVKTCVQKTESYDIPIQVFGTGGIIGFGPEDVNGVTVDSCPSVLVDNPIIKDIPTCEHYGQGAPY